MGARSHCPGCSCSYADWDRVAGIIIEEQDYETEIEEIRGDDDELITVYKTRRVNSEE